MLILMLNKYFLFKYYHTHLIKSLFQINIFTLNLIFITIAQEDKFVEKLDLQKSEVDLRKDEFDLQN